MYGKDHWPDKNKALVCVGTDGYENLSHNMAEAVRFIKQLQAEIKFYEDLALESVTQ